MFGKNTRVFAATAFLFALLAIPKAAWAQSASTDLEYNEQTGILTIAGNIGEEALQRHNRSVTIQVFNPNQTDIDEETKDSIEKALYNFYQLMSDEDGNFAYSTKIVGISGYCLVRVRPALDENYFERTVFIASESEYNAARDEINAQTDAAGMREALLKYNGLYNFTHSIQDELLKKDEKGKYLNSISEYILSKVHKQPYTDFKNIASDLDMELHVWNVLLEPDNEIQIKLLEEYAEYFALTKNEAYTTQYFGLKMEEKKDIMQLLMGACPSNAPELKDKFFQSVLLNGLNVIQNWQDVGTVLSANSACIPAELYTVYANKTSMHANIHKAVAAEKYNKFDRFITVFTAAVNAKEPDKNSHSGSSGGGGYYPLVKPDTKQEMEENKQETTAPYSYDDLSAVGWAEESIYKLSEMKVLSGRGNSIFAPQDNVTREEFVKMLVMAFRSYNSEAKCSFDDVNEGDWYYPYVASAFEIGIVNGIDDRYFGAGRLITREEMAAMSYRAVMLTSNARFEDAEEEMQWKDQEEISDYARSGIAALYNAGILQGIGDGRFESRRNATRAEAAVLVYKLILFTR